MIVFISSHILLFVSVYSHNVMLHFYSDCNNLVLKKKFTRVYMIWRMLGEINDNKIYVIWFVKPVNIIFWIKSFIHVSREWPMIMSSVVFLVSVWNYFSFTTKFYLIE